MFLVFVSLVFASFIKYLSFFLVYVLASNYVKVLELLDGYQSTYNQCKKSLTLLVQPPGPGLLSLTGCCLFTIKVHNSEPQNENCMFVFRVQISI